MIRDLEDLFITVIAAVVLAWIAIWGITPALSQEAAIAIVGEPTEYERGFSAAFAEANATVINQAQLTRRVDQCWRNGGAWVWASMVDTSQAYCGPRQ